MIDRLHQFIKNQGISIRAFEQSISASDGMIRRAITNRSDIQSKWLAIIADNYPHLSLDWLITGRGSMLRSNEGQTTSQTLTQSITQQNSSDEAIVYYKMYKEKDEKVEELLKEIGCLEERLRQLEASQRTSQDKKQSDEITLAFSSESLEDSTQDSLPTRETIMSSKKLSAGKTL